MRALVQRIRWAELELDGQVTQRVEAGLLVYLGVAADDDESDARWLAEKVANLRIFDDEQGKLNRSVRDVGGDILGISNFTLLGDGRRGRRPSFAAAAPPGKARPLNEAFLAELAKHGVRVAGGVFGAHMRISSQADGPVNIVLDSPKPDPP